jgi:hypothetical protein
MLWAVIRIQRCLVSTNCIHLPPLNIFAYQALQNQDDRRMTLLATSTDNFANAWSGTHPYNTQYQHIIHVVKGYAVHFGVKILVIYPRLWILSGSIGNPTSFNWNRLMVQVLRQQIYIAVQTIQLCNRKHFVSGASFPDISPVLKPTTSIQRRYKLAIHHTYSTHAMKRTWDKNRHTCLRNVKVSS